LTIKLLEIFVLLFNMRNDFQELYTLQVLLKLLTLFNNNTNSLLWSIQRDLITTSFNLIVRMFQYKNNDISKLLIWKKLRSDAFLLNAYVLNFIYECNFLNSEIIT